MKGLLSGKYLDIMKERMYPYRKQYMKVEKKVMTGMFSFMDSIAESELESSIDEYWAIAVSNASVMVSGLTRTIMALNPATRNAENRAILLPSLKVSALVTSSKSDTSFFMKKRMRKMQPKNCSAHKTIAVRVRGNPDMIAAAPFLRRVQAIVTAAKIRPVFEAAFQMILPFIFSFILYDSMVTKIEKNSYLCMIMFELRPERPKCMLL